MMDTRTIALLDGASPLHFPPGAARGIRCSVQPIEPGELRRTVNGQLIDLTRAALRKIRIALSGDGVAMPSAHTLWRGSFLLIAPPIVWTATADAGAAVLYLPRPALSGSLVLRDAVTDAVLPPPEYDAATLSVALPEHANAVVLEYQPIFEVLVTDRSEDHDEWGATVSWSLDLEEV